MREDWIECCFADLLDYVQPTKYIVESTKYNNSYKTPVLTAGKSFIKGFTNETDGIFNNLPTIIFDDFTTATQFVNFEFKVKSSAMKILVPTSKLVNMTFVYHLMQVNQVRSDTHKRYWISVFAKKKIQIPSLVEQRAIVAKIEELFSSLDSGIADLKKAQGQLKIYRQAVLSSSFPKKETVEISELVDNLSQGWSPKCINQSSNDNTQWAVIKTSAIQSGRFVEFENKILPDTLEPREQHEIKKGDILITRAGPRVRVGICCLVRKTRPKLINCDKVYRLELNHKLVDAEYFEYALNSPEILRKIEKMKSGSNDSGLNLTQKVFLKLHIPFTSKVEQHQIVCEIESRLSVCDKVEESITESLEKAKALRQSILKKAFEGKLLSPKEITKCKAEKDYEPASVLLEKIKAEKELKQVNKVSPKKKKTK
jgi:type I restriction enzyme, S subunit